MEDHHVDRPGVEVRQRMKLTGTNRSFGLIALIYQCPLAVMAGRLRSRKDQSHASVLRWPGGSCVGPEPDPIPNSAVKPLSAYGTKSQGLGESVAARPAKHRRRTADDRREVVLVHSVEHVTRENSSLPAASVGCEQFGCRGRILVLCCPSSVLRQRGVEQSGSSSGS